MKRGIPLIVAQECNDYDDIDSLLNASLHEQNNLSSHGLGKFQSVYNLKGNQKGQNHQAVETKSSNRNDSVPQDSLNCLTSNTMNETAKTQNSCSSVSGTEVRIVRRDSITSTVTLGESLSKRIDPRVVLQAPHSPCPPNVNAQDSDSSSSYSSAREQILTFKRRSSLVGEAKLRSRSISFNETVDKVTYDDTSWSVSQTSEVLDLIDDQERGPHERRLSLNTSSLEVINDESSPTSRKKMVKILRKITRKKKK